MSKAALQARLLSTIPRRGDPRTLTPEIRLRDVEKFIGVRLRVLAECAHKKRELDDGLQLQLSSFFTLVDRGTLVKVREGEGYVMRRIPPLPGVPEPPRATIDLSGMAPRIKWGP